MHCLFCSPPPAGALQPAASTSLLLMAKVTKLAAAGNANADRAEADRLAAAATTIVVDVCSITVAEVDHMVVEADRLATEATRAWQEAARAQLALHGWILLLLQTTRTSCAHMLMHRLMQRSLLFMCRPLPFSTSSP
jgi:hypothetical protein